MPEQSQTRYQAVHKRLLDMAPEVMLIFPEVINLSYLSIWEPYLLRCPLKVCGVAKSLDSKKKPEGFPFFFQDEGFNLGMLTHTPSVKLLLYPTNRARNFYYFYNLPKVKHVYIGHGDSDKVSSASRFCTVYDYLLVADEQARRRFRRNKVIIPSRRFFTMGSPTFPGLELRAKPAPLRNILYAPTFEGKTEPKNYTSIVRAAPALLAQSAHLQGRTLAFRPHPALGVRLDEAKTQRAELAQAFPVQVAGKTKAEQFNWADVLLTDISGVQSEFLFTGKPIIIPASKEDTRILNALRRARTVEHLYLWDYTQTSLSDFIDSISADPLFEKRLTFRNSKFCNAQTFEESSALFNKALQAMAYPSRLTKFLHRILDKL